MTIKGRKTISPELKAAPNLLEDNNIDTITKSQSLLSSQNLSRIIFGCDLQDWVDFHYFACVADNKVFCVSRSCTEPINLSKRKSKDASNIEQKKEVLCRK